jgi:hypothetical protein
MVSDIPARDGEIDNLCLQCMLKVQAAFCSTGDSVGFGQLPEQAKKSFLYFVYEFIWCIGHNVLFMYKLTEIIK